MTDFPKGYGFEPEYVSSVDKEWLVEKLKDPYFCRGGKFDKYEALLMLIPGVLIPRCHCNTCS